MAKVTVLVDGTKYEMEQEDLLVSEAIEIQGLMGGMPMARWQWEMNSGEPLGTKGLVYLLKKRAGENPDWNTLEFRLAAVEFETEDEPEDPAGAETS